MRKGKMIILNGTGHSEVDTRKNTAMKLLEQGYMFWHNVGDGEKMELGERVAAKDIREQDNIIAMKQISGG